VFENAADFDTRVMQALARQFNLSETTERQGRRDPAAAVA
jgi:predicted PhzF superfamily epimerase YddE/YHI9